MRRCCPPAHLCNPQRSTKSHPDEFETRTAPRPRPKARPPKKRNKLPQMLARKRRTRLLSTPSRQRDSEKIGECWVAHLLPPATRNRQKRNPLSQPDSSTLQWPDRWITQVELTATTAVNRKWRDVQKMSHRSYHQSFAPWGSLGRESIAKGLGADARPRRTRGLETTRG